MQYKFIVGGVCGVGEVELGFDDLSYCKSSSICLVVLTKSSQTPLYDQTHYPLSPTSMANALDGSIGEERIQ